MKLVLENHEVTVDIPALRKEMDGYFEEMAEFRRSDPRDNLMKLSAYSARMGHARAHIIRKGESKIEANFRTKELDPFITECDRQFKIWSRLITYAQVEWDMSKGGY